MNPIIVGLGALGGILALKGSNGEEPKHPLAEALEYMRDRDLKLYEPLMYDLSDARTDEEIRVAGDQLVVESLDGVASLKFNRKSNESLSLNRLRSFNTPFEQFFLTNTAQAGLTLRLAIGRDAAFLVKALEATKLADSSGSDIDPALKAQFTPLSLVSIHQSAEVAATDILASDLTPTNDPALFRVMVMLSAAGVFSVQLKKTAVTEVLNCNGGVALTASAVYMFDHLVGTGDTVNYQTSVNGNVTMRIQEIVGAVQ